MFEGFFGEYKYKYVGQKIDSIRCISICIYIFVLSTNYSSIHCYSICIFILTVYRYLMIFTVYMYIFLDSLNLQYNIYIYIDSINIQLTAYLYIYRWISIHLGCLLFSSALSMEDFLVSQ